MFYILVFISSLLFNCAYILPRASSSGRALNCNKVFASQSERNNEETGKQDNVDNNLLKEFADLLANAAAAFNKTKSAIRSESIYEDHEETGGVEYGLRYYREYAKRGIQRFMDRNLMGALDDFDRAIQSNNSQPLIQRGITLYLLDRYAEAANQFRKDIELIEKPMMFKASDLRLWLSACMNKLGQLEEGQNVLEVLVPSPSGLDEKRFLMNSTLHFFSGQKRIEDMLEIIGAADEKDTFGLRFFGNFYLALYYDSIGDEGLAKAFLSVPCSSEKYPKRDMWYHLPRLFASQRGWTEVDSSGEAKGAIVTKDGMILQ